MDKQIVSLRSFIEMPTHLNKEVRSKGEPLLENDYLLIDILTFSQKELEQLMGIITVQWG